MIEFFDKEISVKERACNVMGAMGRPIAPAVMLFVKATNKCNAHCKFCSNAGCAENDIRFDLDKLLRIVEEIMRKKVLIGRINITGGEPSCVSKNVIFPLLEAFSSEKLSLLHLHLNTNGLLTESRSLMSHPRWNSISISLHHYDLDKLSELYDTKISSIDFRNIDMNKVNASCNLIKGYIDNAEEIEKMMKWCISIGVPRLGFVSLMKVNNYCMDHFVDFDEFNWSGIPHLYHTCDRDRGLDCKCSNYLFNHEGKVLEVYMRNYMNPNYCESSLLFDGQYLRQGFHDDNIIY